MEEIIENNFKRLVEISEIIEDEKTNSTINESKYINLMNNLRDIYKLFKRDEDDIREFVFIPQCICTKDQFLCSHNISTFNHCKKKYELLKETPFLAEILNNHYIAQINIPKINLQITPIDYTHTKEYFYTLMKFFLKFFRNMDNKQDKFVIIFCIFHIMFKNFKYITNDEKFKKVAINKLNDFMTKNIEWENITGMNINTNPLPIWLSYLQKEELK